MPATLSCPSIGDIAPASWLLFVPYFLLWTFALSMLVINKYWRTASLYAKVVRSNAKVLCSTVSKKPVICRRHHQSHVRYRLRRNCKTSWQSCSPATHSSWPDATTRYNASQTPQHPPCSSQAWRSCARRGSESVTLWKPTPSSNSKFPSFPLNLWI